MQSFLQLVGVTVTLFAVTRVHGLSSYAWSFQSVFRVPESGGGDGIAPSHLLGRGFISVISGYDRNQSGIYVHTTDEGLAIRGGYIWSQQQKLVPLGSPVSTSDQFGKWMVHSSTTLIVAAPGMGAMAEGNVYVFNGTLRHWSQVQKLVPDDAKGKDLFGEYLALDENRLVIAAPGTAGSTGDGVGAAYIYERAVGQLQWSRSSKLIARDGQVDTEPGSNSFKSVSLLGEWVVGSSKWDNPTISGYCTTSQSGMIQDRKCNVDEMTGSAYLFKLTSGVGWSQQQKLVSDELIQAARKDPDPLTTRSNKLGSRRFGSDVRLMSTNKLSCSGPSCPGPLSVLAVSSENADAANTIYKEVFVYGVSTSGTTWSLQQQLFANASADYTSNVVVNRTTLFANDDTLVANLQGPHSGLSYIFRTERLGTPENMVGAWSLQQILSGTDIGTPLVNPVIRGGTLLHGDNNGGVVQHSRFHNGSCLLLHLTDHRGDGWDTAILTLRAPDTSQDYFHPHCDQPDPFYVRYCPYQPEDTGIYIAKVYSPTRARFFWEMSYRIQVEATGEWFGGDFSTKMRFIYQKNPQTGLLGFQFYDAENLIDPAVDSLSTRCMRCSRISRETWADQQLRRSSFFPIAVWNAYYYISDYEARNLFASGQVCSGVFKWSCYQTLPDGLYTLRLGLGPLGKDLGYPYGAAGWRGCGRSGGYNDQLVFRVINGKCQVVQVFSYTSRCLRPAPLDQPALMNNETFGWASPTSGGTQAPTQNVFGEPYRQYYMYSLDGDGRQHATYTRDAGTGKLVRTTTRFSGDLDSAGKRDAIRQAEKLRLYSQSVSAGAGNPRTTKDSSKIAFKSQAEDILGKHFIATDTQPAILPSADELVLEAIKSRGVVQPSQTVDDTLGYDPTGFTEVLMQEAHLKARSGMGDERMMSATLDELVGDALKSAASKHGDAFDAMWTGNEKEVIWERDKGSGWGAGSAFPEERKRHVFVP